MRISTLFHAQLMAVVRSGESLSPRPSSFRCILLFTAAERSKIDLFSFRLLAPFSILYIVTYTSSSNAITHIADLEILKVIEFSITCLATNSVAIHLYSIPSHRKLVAYFPLFWSLCLQLPTSAHCL